MTALTKAQIALINELQEASFRYGQEDETVFSTPSGSPENDTAQENRDKFVREVFALRKALGITLPHTAFEYSNYAAPKPDGPVDLDNVEAYFPPAVDYYAECSDCDFVGRSHNIEALGRDAARLLAERDSTRHVRQMLREDPFNERGHQDDNEVSA